MCCDYEGTEIDMVYASYSCEDTVKYAVGIIDTVAGKGFGSYAECGIVHEEPKGEK